MDVDNITAIPPLMALEVRDTTKRGSICITSSSKTHVSLKG